MIRPTSIAQPGAAITPRTVAIAARGQPITIALRAGESLLQEMRRGFEAAGFAGGVANPASLALGPFAYVKPALSKTPEHAAFYSDVTRPAGIARVSSCAITVGTRDGSPFFHCHALWAESDGQLSGGHILPEEAIVAEACTVSAFGLDGAGFDAEPDPETNFKLFGPAALAARGSGTSEAYALRLRPNQDFAGTLERFCSDRGIVRARLHGGVGSIIGAEFTDGRIVAPFATELAVCAGSIKPGDGGALEADLQVALVDYTGGRFAGQLARGRNPILMTMELVLEILERQ